MDARGIEPLRCEAANPVTPNPSNIRTAAAPVPGGTAWRPTKRNESQHKHNEDAQSLETKLKDEDEKKEPSAECLVVSGSLDRSICVFRACFGEGLHLLRRLNLACSFTSLPEALLVGMPADGDEGLGKKEDEV